MESKTPRFDFGDFVVYDRASFYKKHGIGRPSEPKIVLAQVTQRAAHLYELRSAGVINDGSKVHVVLRNGGEMISEQLDDAPRPSTYFKVEDIVGLDVFLGTREAKLTFE